MSEPMTEEKLDSLELLFRRTETPYSFPEATVMRLITEVRRLRAALQTIAVHPGGTFPEIARRTLASLVPPG